MDCAVRMTDLIPLERRSPAIPSRFRVLPMARTPSFADQSHVGFYSKPYRPFGKIRSSETHFEMATASDESVQDVIRQLEELQLKVKVKKRELKSMKNSKREVNANLKARKMKQKMCSEDSSSSSSSESSDSSEDDECKGGMKVVKKKICRTNVQEQHAPSPSLVSSTEVIDTVITSSSSSSSSSMISGAVVGFPKSCGRVEVCTGGKCKKSGSEQVLAAFQQSIGCSGGVFAAAASSCKCMKMCGEGPNVRLQADGNSVPVVYNGVRAEDVGPLLEQLFQVGLSCPIIPC